MSRAAINLHFSQSTISQAIKDLEIYYGTNLFERLSKRLYITHSGKTLQTHAKNVLEEFDKLELIMTEQTGIEHIKFGATITCACSILPKFLKDFEAEFSEVDIVSFIYNTHVIEEKVLNGELDIALVEGNVRSKDLISVPIIDDHLVLAFDANHEFKDKTFFTPTDLYNRDFVVREQGSGTRECFDDYLIRHNVPIKIKAEAPFPEAMRDAIKYNNCIAVMSERLLEEEIKNGEIKILKLNTNEWDRHFSIVYHKDKYLTNSLKYIITLMKSYTKVIVN